MYKLTLLNTSAHIVNLCHVANAYAFCAVAEANDKDPHIYGPASRFQTLLIDAGARLPAELPPEMLPVEMPKAIESVLARLFEHGSGPGTVLYAGVSLVKEKIYVCTAGDCRVHLVKHGNLIAVTRDHNLIDDPTDDIELQQDEFLRQVYLSSITRTIGVASRGRSLECIQWDGGNDSTVVICSSKIHRYRRPSEYIDSLMGDAGWNCGSVGEQPPGILVKIDSV